MERVSDRIEKGWGLGVPEHQPHPMDLRLLPGEQVQGTGCLAGRGPHSGCLKKRQFLPCPPPPDSPQQHRGDRLVQGGAALACLAQEEMTLAKPEVAHKDIDEGPEMQVRGLKTQMPSTAWPSLTLRSPSTPWWAVGTLIELGKVSPHPSPDAASTSSHSHFVILSSDSPNLSPASPQRSAPSSPQDTSFHRPAHSRPFSFHPRPLYSPPQGGQCPLRI